MPGGDADWGRKTPDPGARGSDRPGAAERLRQQGEGHWLEKLKLKQAECYVHMVHMRTLVERQARSREAKKLAIAVDQLISDLIAIGEVLEPHDEESAGGERVATSQVENLVDEAREEKAEDGSLLHQFRGKVHRVEDGIAHVSLVDEQGVEQVATCDAAELASYGITAATDFQCVFTRQGNGTTVRFEPLPRRNLTAANWQVIHDDTVRALGDYDPANDR
jgi:hypothetical protein